MFPIKRRQAEDQLRIGVIQSLYSGALEQQVISGFKRQEQTRAGFPTLYTQQ